MVSLIQSNYEGFGSGLVVPGLGFGLQDRGSLFNMEAAPPPPASLALQPRGGSPLEEGCYHQRSHTGAACFLHTA